VDFLTALDVLAPPPAGVHPSGDEAWARFEAENGFRPPADYRALVDRYGVGGFGYEARGGSWLTMLHPFRGGTSFVEQSAWLRSVNIGMQRRFPELEPDWPMWPAAGGFLQWAESVEGDQVGWLTAGVPDGWGTAIYGRQMDHYRFPFGCVEFLYRCFTGSLGVDDLQDLAGDDLRYYPSPPPDPATLPPRAMAITAVLSGLGAGADFPRPSPQALFDPGITMEERRRRADEYHRTLDTNAGDAIAIVERWTAAAGEHGVRASGGRLAHDASDPLHWEIALDFDPRHEDLAKQLLIDLAGELGVSVLECRNLEYDLVWDDVVGRTR
jgi:hypothetical protein